MTVPSRYAQLELRTLKEGVWPASERAQAALFHQEGWSAQPQECVWVVAYDSKHNLRSIIEVARGSHLGAQVHVPTLLAAVMTSGAERFVLVHNHPNGDPRPSKGDEHLTNSIVAASRVCWLYLEDHLIVTPNPSRYYSFVQAGLYTPWTYGTEQNVAASQ